MEASRRRALRPIREESENSTTASVASASLRTVELVGPTVRSSSTRGPARTPMATTTIAGVIGVLTSRRETAASSSSVRPTVARPQSTASTGACGRPGTAACGLQLQAGLGEPGAEHAVHRLVADDRRGGLAPRRGNHGDRVHLRAAETSV